MAANVTGRPVWVELSTQDPEGSRAFYSRLFGWDIEVSADPQYGGYATAKLGGQDVAGIGPAQDPGQPTAWSIYIGTQDAAAVDAAVVAAGGTVVVPPFDVGDMGRMTVFQDPTGAFLSAWQATAMPGFEADGAGTYAWAELNSRGVDRAVAFYRSVFGWTDRSSVMPDGMRYIELQQGGESILGAMEMSPMVPAQVPSYWMAYFAADDVDAAFTAAVAAGATEVVAPQDFPGGRFAILSDPQGAFFGLLKMVPRAA